jgi:mono/diheme cytochrome c family protein
VKTKGNKLMTFRAFSIGFSAALLALACGSDDNNNDNGKEDEGEDIPVQPVTPVIPDRVDCTNPLIVAAECNNVQTPTPTPGPAPSVGDSAYDIALEAAQNVLATNCGGCHGGQLTPETAEAGMNYIDDIDQLVATGKIIPLDSAGSRIIQRMQAGEMPPVRSGRPPVTQADINIVAQFIDNPLFWDEEATPASCPDNDFNYDELYQEIAVDLARLDADDALTTRYISLTNRFNAGVCADGTALDRDRDAIAKLVNALSTETTVEPPVPINRDETIFRINLEDYGWDAASVDQVDGAGVDVVDANGNIVNFVDKWEAIVANNVYAVPFVGDDADDAVQDSGTLVPVMFADSLLDVASIGNLYYALIDVDVNDTLDNFILNDLQIDVAANLADEDQVRAGTTKSRISRQDRVIQRDEINIRQGVLWQSFDFLDDQNESIFEDPFGFAEGGTEAIFTLPNGMFGYIIADENSVIVEDSDILLDSSQNNFRAVTSVSCSNCHQTGLIPVVDEVRDVALDLAISSGLNRDEVEQLEAVYPEANEFARIVADDSAGFYQAALNRADLPIQGVDPVSFVFLRFDQDLSLADAAGDLSVTPDFMERFLNELDPVLGVLDSGSKIDRDDFTAVYVNSLCILSAVNENTPDQAVCDAAEALLDQ